MWFEREVILASPGLAFVRHYALSLPLRVDVSIEKNALSAVVRYKVRRLQRCGAED